jgi:hypothetical protein
MAARASPARTGKPTASRSDGFRAAMTAKLAKQDGKAGYASARRPSSPCSGG